MTLCPSQVPLPSSLPWPAQPLVGTQGEGGDGDARRPSPRPTEDGGTAQSVATEGEDVGVIGCHHGQGVGGGGELACPRHCPVQHDGLHQRLLGPAAVVAVVDPATCRGNAAITFSLVPWGAHPPQDLHPTPAPATLPAWGYSSSTKRKKPLGFLRRM